MADRKYYELGAVKEILGKGTRTKGMELVIGRKLIIKGKVKFMEDKTGDIVALALDQEKDPEHKEINMEAAGQ